MKLSWQVLPSNISFGIKLIGDGLAGWVESFETPAGRAGWRWCAGWDKYSIYDLLTTGLLHGLLLFLTGDTECGDRPSV